MNGDECGDVAGDVDQQDEEPLDTLRHKAGRRPHAVWEFFKRPRPSQGVPYPPADCLLCSKHFSAARPGGGATVPVAVPPAMAAF